MTRRSETKPKGYLPEISVIRETKSETPFAILNKLKNMIFGLIDCVLYTLERGPYSEESLNRKGLKRATIENFPSLANAEAGTFISCHTRGSKLSWLIMYFQNAPNSHVCVVTEDGIVTDVTTDGIIQHPASDYLDDKYFIQLVKVPLKDKELAKKHGRDSVGIGYSWYKAIRLGIAMAVGYTRIHPRLFLDVAMTTFAITWLCCTLLGFRTTFAYSSTTAYAITVIINYNFSHIAKRFRESSNRAKR